MGFLVSTKAIISTTAKISIMAVVDILKLKKWGAQLRIVSIESPMLTPLMPRMNAMLRLPP